MLIILILMLLLLNLILLSWYLSHNLASLLQQGNGGICRILCISKLGADTYKKEVDFGRSHKVVTKENKMLRWKLGISTQAESMIRNNSLGICVHTIYSSET